MGGFAAMVAMLGVAGLAIAVGVVTSSASAEETAIAELNDPGSVYPNNATQKCLDSNQFDMRASNPDQGDVYTMSCNNGEYQQWAPIRIQEEYLGFKFLSPFVKLRDVATNRCLDSNEHDAESGNPDQGKVYTLPCNDGHNQQWRVFKPGGDNDPGYIVQNRATGKCLDSNWHDEGAGNLDMGKVYTLPCNGGIHQAWNPFKK